jgi:hypothetical protein
MANIVLWIAAIFDFHDVAVTTRISRIYYYFDSMEPCGPFMNRRAFFGWNS